MSHRITGFTELADRCPTLELQDRAFLRNSVVSEVVGLDVEITTESSFCLLKQRSVNGRKQS